jgi:hypothetical protein
MNKVSLALRILMGVSLMVIVLWVGFSQRSLWTLPLLGLAFTAAYVTGKLRVWRVAMRDGKIGQAIAGLPVTFLVQTVLVGVTYLIGFGLGALVKGEAGLAPFDRLDAMLALLVGLGSALTGILIDQLEGKPDTLIPAWAGSQNLEEHDSGSFEERTFDVDVLDGAVTLQSFFSGIPCSHGADTSTEGGTGLDGTPNQKSAGRTPVHFAEHEARLGQSLPAVVKSLYALQNGGDVNHLCIPDPGILGPCTYGDILKPFSGYNELVPLELIRTVHDSVTDYADPVSDAEAFPEGCAHMLILAQWYRETLFLDYNQPGAPRVGFVDFDQEDWQTVCRWWPSFEAFFSELRHYRDL